MSDKSRSPILFFICLSSCCLFDCLLTDATKAHCRKLYSTEMTDGETSDYVTQTSADVQRDVVYIKPKKIQIDALGKGCLKATGEF